MSALENLRVPRRRFLRGAGTLGLAAILRPNAVFAESDDDDERLGPFGPWSTPVNLGPVINAPSPYLTRSAAISKNGLSLYITSTRPRGVNGANAGNLAEIWVSQRTSLDAPWGTPVNLDAFNSVPVVNSIGDNTADPNFSPDGHLLFFDSNRPGDCGGEDIWVSRRNNKRDDFGWQAPVNLGCAINSPQGDGAPTYFEDEETGIIMMYFGSNRPGGPAGSLPGSEHIWVSTLGDDESFGPAVLVPELSSTANDTRTAIRRDGLEFFLASTRPNGRIGVIDIWVSTRDSTLAPWSSPVNLGSTVNNPGHVTGGPALSWDGTTLYFQSDRLGGFGTLDLYMTTRRKLRRHERRDESARRSN